LARLAEVVTQRAADAGADSWRDRWAAEYLREQLAAASGDVDHHVATLDHPDRYRTIASARQDAGRLAEAADWARRGLAHHPSNP